MSATRILLVEDDERISRYLTLELEHEGYTPIPVLNGAAALDVFASENIDLVLLDLMLPDVSGVEVCRRIRKTSDIPIIMLTAKDATSDKVLGLDLGADDYLTKPFETEELLARIRAVLRRRSAGEESGDELAVGDLVMNLSAKTVVRDGKDIALTKREFELLQHLLENVDVVVSRESLLKNVWHWEYGGETNTVDVYIRYLRDKIDRGFTQPLIQTVRGFGYVIKSGK